MGGLERVFMEGPEKGFEGGGLKAGLNYMVDPLHDFRLHSRPRHSRTPQQDSQQPHSYISEAALDQIV